MPARFRIEDPALAQQLRQIEQLIRRAGGRTWLVGGSVRDLALGRQPCDLDLEISGLPPGQLHALLTEHFSVQLLGKAFGRFKLQGLPVDISIPSRMLTDNESVQGLLKESDPHMDIGEALAQRHFTMNAMAWDSDTLELHDPFNGLIRCPLAPSRIGGL